LTTVNVIWYKVILYPIRWLSIIRVQRKKTAEDNVGAVLLKPHTRKKHVLLFEMSRIVANAAHIEQPGEPYDHTLVTWQFVNNNAFASHFELS